jgi:hypothetical protein
METLLYKTESSEIQSVTVLRGAAPYSPTYWEKSSKDFYEAPLIVQTRRLQFNLSKKFNEDQRKRNMVTPFLDLLAYDH